MFHNCIFIMLGGALGALLRYAVGCMTAGIRVLALPVGTLTVNLLGCLILGLLTGYADHHTDLPRHLVLMLTVGFCGAFTTFSTFSAETLRAAESGHIWQAALYVGVSFTAGFLLFWWGKTLTCPQ